MSPPYVSILLQQPADGDTVFMRRFTRDPPVQAIWSASAQNFTLTNGPTITVVGGTYAGVWPVTYTPSFLGAGKPAWYNLQSPIYILAIEETPGNWFLEERALAVDSYYAGPYPPPAGPQTQTSFTTQGTPSWTGPTSMSISDTSVVPLTIPAALVQAWRPV